MEQTILIVDDDPAMNFALSEVLKKRGYRVGSVFSAEDGLEQLTGDLDLVLLDLRLPGMSGLEAIPHIREKGCECEIIVMTAHGSNEDALKAVSIGAYDYFKKPFELSEMEVIVRRALEKRRLQGEIKALKKKLQAAEASLLVGRSRAMQKVLELAERLAPLDITVLVTGESGTGKELVADTLHAKSRRAGNPFIKVNCAAIPEGLLESELFGTEKGAYTGSVAARPGKFELADKGTIMLDEVGDTPLSIQAKLLRVVEGKRVERLGGTRSIEVDARIIAATHQDLLRKAEAREFREDLYYRLNVGCIRIPPLRERKEDIPALVDHFLRKLNVKLGLDIAGVSRDAMELLLAHEWPGNVRELSNTMERAAVMSSDHILTGREIHTAMQRGPVVTPAGAESAGGKASLMETMRVMERNLIVDALDKSHGAQIEAARLLGLNPKNLWKKMKKHGL